MQGQGLFPYGQKKGRGQDLQGLEGDGGWERRVGCLYRGYLRRVDNYARVILTVLSLTTREVCPHGQYRRLDICARITLAVLSLTTRQVCPHGQNPALRVLVTSLYVFRNWKTGICLDMHVTHLI